MGERMGEILCLPVPGNTALKVRNYCNIRSFLNMEPLIEIWKRHSNRTEVAFKYCSIQIPVEGVEENNAWTGGPLHIPMQMEHTRLRKKWGGSRGSHTVVAEH